MRARDGVRARSRPTGAWELLDPYAARIDDLDRADVIVVVGDADVADRAGVLELRIRKARRRGAHLMIVGPGGSLLERDAGTVRQTGRRAPTAQALAGARPRSRPARRAPSIPVLIVTDPRRHRRDRRGRARASACTSGAACCPCRPAPNERGARLCGLAGGGDEVLAAIEAGTVRALVLLGVDPTAEWPEADRWQMALAQVEPVVAVAPFVNTSVSWAHFVLPQAVDYEREGTTTNLEGRIQRLRPAVQAAERRARPGRLRRASPAHLGIEISPAARRRPTASWPPSSASRSPGAS